MTTNDPRAPQPGSDQPPPPPNSEPRPAPGGAGTGTQGDPAKKGGERKAADFKFSASRGGRFEIRGQGFHSSGTVKINGRQAETTEWGDGRIAGRVPDGVEGPVQVTLDMGGVTQSGEFRI